MREELSRIDLSPISDLVRIKKEELLLVERLKSMEIRAEKVSSPVYERVRKDYETRRAALEQESRPLKEHARREYRRLEALLREVEQAVEAASLDKEEVEFRREVGEFPDGRLQGTPRGLREAPRRRTPGSRGSAPDEVYVSRRLPVRGGPRDTRLRLRSARSPGSSGPAASRATGASGSAGPPALRARRQTAASLLPAPLARRERHQTAASVRRVPPADSPEPPEATIVLTRARLALLDGDRVTEEFPSKPGVSILGRLALSDVHLPTPDVPRKHAQVIVGPSGVFVVDLESENGVVVNGRKVDKASSRTATCSRSASSGSSSTTDAGTDRAGRVPRGAEGPASVKAP